MLEDFCIFEADIIKIIAVMIRTQNARIMPGSSCLPAMHSRRVTAVSALTTFSRVNTRINYNLRYAREFI